MATGGCRRHPGAGSGERDPCFGQALPRGRKKAAPRRVRQAWPARDSFRHVLGAPGAFRAVRPRDTCLSAGCQRQPSADGPCTVDPLPCQPACLMARRCAAPSGASSPLPCRGAGSGAATKAGNLRGPSAGSPTFFAPSLPESLPPLTGASVGIRIAGICRGSLRHFELLRSASASRLLVARAGPRAGFVSLHSGGYGARCQATRRRAN